MFAAPADWITMASQQDVTNAVTAAVAGSQLAAQVNTISGQVNALYVDNKIDGEPYGKQAAGFNDVRALAEVVAAVAAQVNALYVDNHIDGEPYAGFNDVRTLAAKVDTLAVRVDFMTAVLTPFVTALDALSAKVDALVAALHPPVAPIAMDSH